MPATNPLNCREALFADIGKQGDLKRLKQSKPNRFELAQAAKYAAIWGRADFLAHLPWRQLDSMPVRIGEAARYAIEFNHPQCLKAIPLDKVHRKAIESGMKRAVIYNFFACLQELPLRRTSKFERSYAWQLAHQLGHVECKEILMR